MGENKKYVKLIFIFNQGEWIRLGNGRQSFQFDPNIWIMMNEWFIESERKPFPIMNFKQDEKTRNLELKITSCVEATKPIIDILVEVQDIVKKINDNEWEGAENV